MLPSLRSALLICAALAVTAVAPANAGPATEPLAPLNLASLPEVPMPDLLDPDGQPQLMGAATPEVATPEEDDLQLPSTDEADDGADDGPVRPSGDLSSLVAQLSATDPGSHELECLAVGVYFESKSEPLAGQLAVGKVIANRANSGGRFPPSYCGVLFQRGQFSFVRGHSLPHVARSGKQWRTAVAIARIVDQDLKDSVAEKALFFHARRVSPGWHLKRVAAIGNHIFYR
jgi:spore germination cell wall hydrolase CwlJ-like protein